MWEEDLSENKILLGIINCHSRSEMQEIIRNTWLPYCPKDLDVKFFLGRGGNRKPLQDEVFLDCGDEYLDLPEKVQAMFKWAYSQGYNYVAKVDDDVVVKPAKWLSTFNKTDFSGWQDPGCKPGEIRTPWGFFYVLNRRSMSLIIDSPLPGKQGSIHSHVHGNDEAWISTILHYSGIFLTHDKRYFIYQGNRDELLNIEKRPLRRFNRQKPPKKEPEEETFAACIYLNWSGWHNTGKEIIVREFQKVWDSFKSSGC